MTIVCTGSIAYDYLMSFPGYFRDHILPDKLDCISLSFLVDSMVRQRGGVAPNIAYTLALLGDRPLLVGTVGEDFAEYGAWLESQGVNTAGVKVIQGKYTASFFANTDRSNAQIASFYPGAMAHAAEQTVDTFLDINPELVVISPNDPAAMNQFVLDCQKAGLRYLYDPGQQVVRSSPEELRAGVEGAYSLFLNDYEFGLIQKHTGLSPERIKELVKVLVVTRGEKGATIYTEGKEFEIPTVPPEQILDPTGVGDAFRGGFLRGYQLKLGWEVCGQMGALAATYCLEQRGTQNHAYTLQEFVERFRKHFDDQGALDALLAYQ